MITGITGFAGSHLAEYLLAAYPGVAIYGLISGSSSLDNLSMVHQYVRLRQVNLLAADQVLTAVRDIQPDWVFHLAAQAFVPQSWADPMGTLTANIGSVVGLLEALVKSKQQPRILLVGSGDVYGMVKPEENPLTETQPLRPTSPYAVSKATQELLGYQYWVSRQLPIVRVRAFNHIGSRQRDSFVLANFAHQIAEIEAGQSKPVVQVGNLEAKRDFSNVRDIVRGYVLLLEQGIPGEIYNLGSGMAHSIASLLSLLLNMSHTPISIEQDPARLRPTDVPLIVADITKVRAATGWQSAYTLEETLAEIMHYWRQQVQQASPT